MSQSSASLKLTRRDLFKGAGAAVATGAVVASSRDARAFGLLEAPEALPAEREVPTVCEVCFWNCGLIAHARGNRVLEVREAVGRLASSDFLPSQLGTKKKAASSGKRKKISGGCG